jgi:hypothetical protein
MAHEGTHLQLQVGDDNADPEELADLTARLRNELLDLDIEAVEALRIGPPPPGARAVDLMAIGTLIATFTRPDLLVAVVAAVRTWLGGTGGRSVKLELDGDALELTGVSSKEQRRLTDEWLRRHATA